MSGSFTFLVHLIGFGIISTVVVAGWILDRIFKSETDLKSKLYVGNLMRSIGLLSPFAALLMLATGIGNIFNRYTDASIEWYQESWLVVKIFFFAMFVVNGTLLGPRLTRNRMNAVRTMTENDPGKDVENNLPFLDRQVSLFYLVQSVLLVIILYFSSFGTSKHPGFF